MLLPYRVLLFLALCTLVVFVAPVSTAVVCTGLQRAVNGTATYPLHMSTVAEVLARVAPATTTGVSSVSGASITAVFSMCVASDLCNAVCRASSESPACGANVNGLVYTSTNGTCSGRLFFTSEGGTFVLPSATSALQHAALVAQYITATTDVYSLAVGLVCDETVGAHLPPMIPTLFIDNSGANGVATAFEVAAHSAAFCAETRTHALDATITRDRVSKTRGDLTATRPAAHTASEVLTNTNALTPSQRLPHTASAALTSSDPLTLTRRLDATNSLGLTMSDRLTPSFAGRLSKSSSLRLTTTKDKDTKSSPVTASVSSSATRSTTRTPPPVPTPTETHSTTRSKHSPTASVTRSQVVTDTPPISKTKSLRVSVTDSASYSKATTPTDSQIATASRAATPSSSFSLRITRTPSGELSESDSHLLTHTKSLPHLSRSLSDSNDLTASRSLMATSTPTDTIRLSPSMSAAISRSFTITVSKSVTVIPPQEVVIRIGENATVFLGSAVPLPILQRVTLQFTGQTSNALQAVAGMATTTVMQDGVAPASPLTAFPEYSPQQLTIVAVLSLTPEMLPSYTPEAYGSILPVALCAMIPQANTIVPFTMVMVSVILNTTSGRIITGGTGINQLKMPQAVPTDNVPMDYGGYALYQLVFVSNPAPVVLLVRPTTLVFMASSMLADPGTQVFSVPSQVVAYNLNSYSTRSTLAYSSMTRLLTMQATETYVIVYTRDGVDVCARAVGGIPGSGAVNITTTPIAFQLIDNDTKHAHATIVSGCLRLGNTATGDYINSIVSDFDEGAAEDGWLGSADHKTVLVPANVHPLPSFVFRTSLSCTVAAVQLIATSNGTSGVTLPSYTMIVGDLVSFTACSDTPPVVLSSRIFGSPVDNVDFPFVLMVWGGALSLVNTSGGTVLATILAPGNTSQQTLLLPFWMPPVDSPVPSSIPETGLQRLPFLMVRDSLIELVELRTVRAAGGTKSNVTLTLQQITTEDIHQDIQAVALVPPFSYAVPNVSYFEALALISAKPNIVITALLRPSKKSLNTTDDAAVPLIHYRQKLVLPSIEQDYVLSIKRWNREATQTKNSSNLQYGNCSFLTDLVPRASKDDPPVFQVVHGEVFQLNTLRMAFLICVDQTYGLIEVISDMSASPSGVEGGVMRFTTPTYILSAHQQEFTVVSLGPSFYAALTKNGSSSGVSWHAYNPYLQFQTSSLISPHRAKAANYTTPLPSNGMPLSKYYQIEVFAFEGFATIAVVRDMMNGGRKVCDVNIGRVCNQSSEFLVVDPNVDVDKLVGLVTVSFVCLYDYVPAVENASPPSVSVAVATIILNASVSGGISEAQRPQLNVIDVGRFYLSAAPPPSATVYEGAYEFPSINLIQFTMMACVSTGPPSNTTTVCRIVLAVSGLPLMLITPRIDDGAPMVTLVNASEEQVLTAVGMQLSQRGPVGYLLSTSGISAINVMNGSLLWMSNTRSVCYAPELTNNLIPSDTPCHIEVMDELCDYGGACTLLLVGYDANRIANIQGFDSRGEGASSSSPTPGVPAIDPTWSLLPSNTSSDDPTVAFLSELLAPTQKWNSKVYLLSAANLSVSCYSVRDTDRAPTQLWTKSLVDADSEDGSTVYNFLEEVLNNARGTSRNPCFGLLRVSDFGIVVVVLRCSMSFQEPVTQAWRVATYSVMLGLDAFSGNITWSVEPITYNVRTVTSEGNTIIHQPRSFLADEVRGYVVWNATILLAQISASPYFPNSSDNATDPWFHSQTEEERNIVGIDLLNGTILFQIPVPRPSNASSESEYGSASNKISHIPGTIPSPSALLLSLVPSTSILIITEYASRTTWATDVALFPLGKRITDVELFYTERLPSLEAFYVFGTLDNVPSSWRPALPLAAWECTNLLPYSQLSLQNLGTGAVSLAVEAGGCIGAKGLVGILNWTAIPRPFDPVWETKVAPRVAENAPILGGINTLSLPAQGLVGRFDFALLRHTGIAYLDLSSNDLAGVLTSFDGLPTTMEWINLSNQTLYAGDQLPGAAKSTLFTSAESLSFLQDAQYLLGLDLSANILSARVARDFLLYVPSSLRTLNLSNTNLYGQLFDFTSPVDNASSSSSAFVGRDANDPNLSDRARNAMLKANLMKNASASGLFQVDVSHNAFEDDPTTSRLMQAYCGDLYTLSLQTLMLQNNRIAAVAPPNFFSINTTNASTIPTLVNQCQLAHLDLSGNNISGALDLSAIAKTLRFLNLSHNDMRDVVDLSDVPTLWHSNLTTLDVRHNPQLAGVLAPECPPRAPRLFYDAATLPCTQNSAGFSDSLYSEAICSDLRLSSMIMPYLNPNTNTPEPGKLTMYYTQNQTDDPSSETFLTNCTFDTNRLLRFGDGRIGYLDLFVFDTAPCLPRNMLIIEAFVYLTPAIGSTPGDVNATMVVANVSIRYFRNASDDKNLTLAQVATVVPDIGTETYWCNYTNSSCSYLGGSYCMLDTDSTPYRLSASAAGGVTLYQYGGYSQSILTTHECFYNATVMVLPVALGGSTLFPNYDLLAPLIACLPTTLGRFNTITMDGGDQLEIQDSTPVPAQFEAQICDHLPSPTNCPLMPSFAPPASVEAAQQAQTCVDGFCANVKSIMWQPCGTSIWNYDGFHAVGECRPLSSILRLPMESVKDPTPPACVYGSDPPTCAEYAGRWTSFGVNLFLQAIQPDFYNNTLIGTYKENCETFPPLCASPYNSTLADNVTDDGVFCYLLEYLSQPSSQVMVTGYCDDGGESVFLTTCGGGGLQIPILQLNSSACLNGIQAFCSSCLPYIEPRATSLPYAFMIISSLKDIVFILLGAYFLSKPWFRRPVTMCLTKMLLSITPLNAREKQRYTEVLMARFNPLVIAPGELYDICDELLIKDDARRREYFRRKNDSFGADGPDGVLPDGHLYDEGNGGEHVGGSASKNRSDKHSMGSSHRSWREELTLDNFLRTIGFRRNTTKDMSLNAETTTEGSGGGAIISDRTAGGGTIPVTSRRSNLSEPMLRETAGAIPIDKEHPLEQHSSTLFSEEGVLVDDNVESEVLQHFYRYYREAVCEHSRRQIGNVNHPLVRQRFQRLFEVYTEMFHKSQFGRERLMSNVFLDIQDDELEVDVSQNFYSSFVVTSRSLQNDPTASRMSTTATRLHQRRHAASSAGRHPSGHNRSNSVFSARSAAGSEAVPYSSAQLGRSATNRFTSIPPSATRRSAMHELTESFVRERDAGAAGSPMSMNGGRVRNSMGEEMMPIAAPVSDKEIKILEALEDELQLAKEELFEVSEMVPILLVPTMVDARFTPQAWMLVLEGAYCVLYFLVCVYESSTVPGYGGWLVYNAVYFRYVNSCSSVGLVVNALLRRVYLDEPLIAYDPFIVTALALMGPAIFSHVIPGIVLYAWIHALVLVVWLPCCWIMRQLEKRFFYTLDPISILFRVCFRLGTTIVATLLIQSSYNWALLYYMKHESLGYLGILEYEYDSRTWSCLIESRLQSLANIVQFLSAFV